MGPSEPPRGPETVRQVVGIGEKGLSRQEPLIPRTRICPQIFRRTHGGLKGKDMRITKKVNRRVDDVAERVCLSQVGCVYRKLTESCCYAGTKSRFPEHIVLA